MMQPDFPLHRAQCFNDVMLLASAFETSSVPFPARLISFQFISLHNSSVYVVIGITAETSEAIEAS